MTVSAFPAAPTGQRRKALLQLAILSLLVVALSVPLSPSEVIGAAPGMKLALLGRMALLVAVATWMLRSAGKRWSDVGLRAPRRWWIVGVAVVAGYLALGGAAALLQILVLPRLGLAGPDLAAFAGLRGDLPEYLFWALPVAFGSAAFGEELVARGFLTDRIATLMGGAAPGGWVLFAAVLLQGVLFGACHAYQGLGGALVTAVVGMVLGLVWLWTGRNLWACIFLHGLVDFVSMTAFYTGAVGGPA